MQYEVFLPDVLLGVSLSDTMGIEHTCREMAEYRAFRNYADLGRLGGCWRCTEDNIDQWSIPRTQVAIEAG